MTKSNKLSLGKLPNIQSFPISSIKMKIESKAASHYIKKWKSSLLNQNIPLLNFGSEFLKLEIDRKFKKKYNAEKNFDNIGWSNETGKW